MVTVATVERRKTGVVNVRIDAQDKHSADLVMEKLGVTPTEVIRLLYRQITLQRRLPFEVALPSETLEAVEEIDKGGGSRYASVEDLMSELKIQ